VEFLAAGRRRGGSFTVVPILNYLLASAAFTVFGWAVLHGMFRDIERQKYDAGERAASR
jgi:hypothetical protein